MVHPDEAIDSMSRAVATLILILILIPFVLAFVYLFLVIAPFFFHDFPDVLNIGWKGLGGGGN